MSGFRKVLQRAHWILSSQLGWDPRVTLRSAKGFPRYLNDVMRFKAEYDGELEVMPCLHDWYEEGGTTRSEYFWQDLLVAKMIFDASPERHVDIGSRVDGFVAHVASFRSIEVFDVRPITTRIPGIEFTQADLTKTQVGFADYCDSLSCLHALEHFGLGRYGDPLDPNGFAKGLASMAVMLRPNGKFYLSTPIGRARIAFNAHRVSDPRTVVALATSSGLQLQSLTVVRGGEHVQALQGTADELASLAAESYTLGIFVFTRKQDGVA